MISSRRLSVSLLLASILLFCAMNLADGQEAAPDDRIAAVNDQLVKLTNSFRKETKLDRLAVDEQLQTAAADFAKFMATESKYGHTADGRRPAERAEAAGYDYCVVRENIAYSTDPAKPAAEELAQQFFTGWKESEEHRENMLAPHIQHIGVAVATKDGTTFYAVQMFGRPESAKFEIEIKNELESVQEIVLRSEGTSDAIEIQPRTVLKLVRCLPTTLALGSAKVRRGQPVSEAAAFLILSGPDGEPQLKKR